MPDLDSRTQIHDFVVSFYRAVIFDDVLEPVFDDIAEVDWAAHIPRLVDYWCRVVLGEPGYVGAMFAAHQHVHDIQPFRPEWFDRWHALFASTLGADWSGPGCNKALAHAERNLAAMSRRLTGADWAPPGTPATPSRRAGHRSRGGRTCAENRHGCSGWCRADEGRAPGVDLR